MREAAEVQEVRPAAAGGGFGGWPVPPAVVVAAAAALALLVAAVAAVVAVSGRSSGSGVGATVVPARADVTAAQQAGSAADSRAAAAGAAAPATSQAQGTSPVPVTAPSCAAAPTVQLQGRGLVATGVAPVAPGPTPVSALTVTVQERGGDAAAVLGAVQTRSQAVLAALKQAGVPDSDVQQTSFSSYGDLQGRQYTAYATIQAQVEGADRLTQATRAVSQVPGISGYSAGSAQLAQPSADEVQAAVTGAASQARDMAAATARAAGVTLGAVSGVTTQPPTLCYGQGGPSRVVQVTLTYALR